VTHLDTVAPADLQLLKMEYPKWTFTTTAAGTGTFNVLQYDPFALTTLGGADFTVLYDDQVATARTDYDWVQIAHPQNWGSRDSKDFVDSRFSNFPFHSNYIPSSLPTLMTPTSFFGPGIWLNKDGKHPQQKIQNPAGGGDVPAGDLLFVDEPFCSYSCVPLRRLLGNRLRLVPGHLHLEQHAGRGGGGNGHDPRRDGLGSSHRPRSGLRTGEPPAAVRARPRHADTRQEETRAGPVPEVSAVATNPIGAGEASPNSARPNTESYSTLHACAERGAVEIARRLRARAEYTIRPARRPSESFLRDLPGAVGYCADCLSEMYDKPSSMIWG
jgi:hypothetical protein